MHLPKAYLSVALSEIWRVLAPSGVFYASLQAGQGDGFEPVDALEGKGKRYFWRYSLAELVENVEKAGFTIMDFSFSSSEIRQWIWVFSRKETN